MNADILLTLTDTDGCNLCVSSSELLFVPVAVQVVMCSCSYLVLFMGNFFTTLGVVYEKYMNNPDKKKSL